MAEPNDRQGNPAEEPQSGYLGGKADPEHPVAGSVEELQARVRRLSETWEAENAEELRVLAQELRSAARGSGLPSLRACAAEFEQLLVAEQAEASALTEKLEEFIRLCKRATA